MFPDSGSEASLAAIRARVDGVDWTEVHADLDAQGWAIVPKLLTDAEVQFGDVHGGAVASHGGRRCRRAFADLAADAAGPGCPMRMPLSGTVTIFPNGVTRFFAAD